MCLISNLPSGTEKYTEEVFKFIKSGMSTNRDGSGFMYKRKDSSIIGVKKGFFDYEELIKEYKNLEFKNEDIVVFHHRWGTSGDVSEENCHPFYLSKDFNKCVNTDGEYNIPAFVHNGVFTIKRDNLSFSDTYAICEKYFSEPEIISLLENKPLIFKDIMKDIIGYQKLSFLLPTKKGLLTFGQFIEENGYYHSNSGYKTTYYDRGGINYEYEDFNDNCPVKHSFREVEQPKETKKAERNLLSIVDSDIINITSKNFEDFYFKQKKDSDDVRFDKNSFYKINNFNDDDNEVGIWSINKGIIVKKEDLPKIFSYVVKINKKDYYSEYIKLNKRLNKTQTTLKKVKKILDKKSTSLNEDVVIYKDWTTFYGCLKMWYDKNNNLKRKSLLETIYD